MTTLTPASRVMLKNVRLSFAQNLFEAGAFKPGDEPKHSSTFLVPKGSELRKEVEAAAVAALDAKFPGKGKTIRTQIEGNNNKCNIQDGDKSSYDGFEGHVAVKANSKTLPAIIMSWDGNPRVSQNDIKDQTERAAFIRAAKAKLYSGCYVNASIEFFGYDSSGKGLSASLRGVQFVRDGDSFAGGRPADADEFESVEEGAGADEFA